MKTRSPFRRRRDRNVGNFIGRQVPEWDVRACVNGYFSELAKVHALNDGFSENFISLLRDDSQVVLAHSLYEPCGESFKNTQLGDKIAEWLTGPKSDRPLDDCLLQALINSARQHMKEGKIRQILVKTLARERCRVATGEELASIGTFGSLKKTFCLDDDDLAIIAFHFCVRNSNELAEIVASWDYSDIHFGMSRCVGITEERCKERLSSQAPLIKSEIVSLGDEARRGSFSYVLQQSIYSYIAMGGHDVLGGMSLERSEGPTHPLESFPVDLSLRKTVIDLLACAGSETRTNILFYGKEGSGKTQFARAVTAASGKKLFMYHQSGNKTPFEPDDLFMLSSVTTTIDGNDSVLLVDEAEDLLATGSCGGFFGAPPPAHVKARIHNILDKARCPIIWIVNHTNRMDASTKRRFTFSVEFQALTPTKIMNLARTWLDDIPVNDSLRERIISLSGNFALTAASLQYLRETVKSVIASGSSEEQTIERVTRLFESNVRLLTGEVPVRPDVGGAYSVEALDTSVPPERLMTLARKALERIDEQGSSTAGTRIGMRFLFHGASGTGKTEFARYVAKSLDRPLLVKRASDILDPYVGGSEQNVAQIFREAESSKSVLLVDEADSFFYDRSTATHSWERTLVNEFLVQMEEFRGVLICSTNHASILDKALARRFHESVEFRPLSRDAIERLLARYYPDLAFTAGDVDAIAQAGPVTPGDFGALRGRTDFMDANEISRDYIAQSLAAMVRAKKPKESAAIGFSS